MIKLIINDQPREVPAEPERPLLAVLREECELTGTKYGCGEGQCGACTVLVDGRAVRSCVLPVQALEGKKITTIEGIGTPQHLHPVQEAFLAEDALQCGYCTSGMIVAAIALLDEKPRPSHDEIVRGMNGNICRCGTYARIAAAVARAAAARSGGER